MLKNLRNSARHWLLRFITLQLFVSLMSLPLLIAWGLPLSMLSPVGNSLFNPLLALFLLLSTLIFVTELIYIPNHWLCWLLEKTNTLFVTTSSYADSSWLVGIRLLPTPLLFIIPMVALWIIITPKIPAQWGRIAALSITLIVIFTGAYLTNGSYLGECASSNKNKPTAIAYANNTLAVFDTGSLSGSFRYRTWWEYTLMPFITTKTGKTSLDYLVCLQPSERTLESLTSITRSTPIRHIIIATSREALKPLQETLASVMQELAAQKIDCTVITQPKEPYKLTDKIQFTPELTPRSKIMTITCNDSTLTLGRPLIDKHAQAL